jgi:hypothetical protein
MKSFATVAVTLILYINVVSLFNVTMLTEANSLNVYGEALQSCSKPGGAMAGMERDGMCTDVMNDAGSHHICIDLSTIMGGDFCSTTRTSLFRRMYFSPLSHKIV